ncbi:MAG: hypothetical protein JSW07_16365 [bacterium]|nr:MAG: hypothetical protein JSW07_16365 [bacterium]
MLTEKEKQLLTQKYQMQYRPLLDALINILVQLERENDAVGLAFLADTIGGLLKSCVRNVLAQDIKTVCGWPIEQ